MPNTKLDLERRLSEIGGLLDTHYCTEDKTEVYALLSEQADIEQMLRNMTEEEEDCNA